MVTLPKELTKRRTALSDQTCMIYGQPKVGKSTFCSQIDSPIFFATEPGLNHLNVFQMAVTNWVEFLEAAKAVATEDHDFKAVVVDTIDNAYKFCLEHVCAANSIKHPADMGYGKGFALVNNEFQRVLTKLAALPYGLFLVSHAQEREIETRTGSYVKAMPTLPEGARKILLGMTDIILFADLEEVAKENGDLEIKRVVRTKPNLRYEAGDRTKNLPDPLPMEYAAFKTAFEKAVK